MSFLNLCLSEYLGFQFKTFSISSLSEFLPFTPIKFFGISICSSLFGLPDIEITNSHKLFIDTISSLPILIVL